MSGAPRDALADLPGVDRLDSLTRRVLAVAGVALLARLVFLGARVSHFDEGRVGWWTLHFLDTGQFEYRFIIHGPLVQHVNRVVFGVFGASDFTLRLFVALVGAALPLAALLFRDHLRDDETLGVAAFLAVNPVLLYYSRFFRSTLLVAAFAFVAFGLFVRALDSRSARYAHLGVAFVALAFAAKENAAVYLLTWLGAAVLVADDSLFRQDGASAFARARDRLSFLDRDYVSAAAVHGVLGLGVFLLITLLFYAPRDPNGVGLWSSVVDPTQIPALLNRTIDDVWTGYSYWFGGPGDTTMAKYLERLGRFLSTSATYAGPLLALSIAGFLAERFLAARPRPLVMFASYWGFASVLGYPLATDIWGAWIIVNALVPLSVPAAVGLRVLVDVGRESLSEADRVSAGIVGVLLLFVVGQVVVVGAPAAFVQPASPDNDLVQFSQPQPEIREPADRTAAVAAAHEGDPDVLFYGSDDFVDGSGFRSPECIRWIRTLPWAWYVDRAGASVTCAREPGGIPDELPPVVVAEADCTRQRTVECRTAPEDLAVDDGLDARLSDDYERYGFLHRTTGGSYFDGMVVFVREDATPAQSASASAFRSQRAPARR